MKTTRQKVIRILSDYGILIAIAAVIIAVAVDDFDTLTRNTHLLKDASIKAQCDGELEVSKKGVYCKVGTSAVPFKNGTFLISNESKEK